MGNAKRKYQIQHKTLNVYIGVECRFNLLDGPNGVCTLTQNIIFWVGYFSPNIYTYSETIYMTSSLIRFQSDSNTSLRKAQLCNIRFILIGLGKIGASLQTNRLTHTQTCNENVTPSTIQWCKICVLSVRKQARVASSIFTRNRGGGYIFIASLCVGQSVCL